MMILDRYKITNDSLMVDCTLVGPIGALDALVLPLSFPGTACSVGPIIGPANPNFTLPLPLFYYSSQMLDWRANLGAGNCQSAGEKGIRASFFPWLPVMVSGQTYCNGWEALLEANGWGDPGFRSFGSRGSGVWRQKRLWVPLLLTEGFWPVQGLCLVSLFHLFLYLLLVDVQLMRYIDVMRGEKHFC